MRGGSDNRWIVLSGLAVLLAAAVVTIGDRDGQCFTAHRRAAASAMTAANDGTRRIADVLREAASGSLAPKPMAPASSDDLEFRAVFEGRSGAVESIEQSNAAGIDQVVWVTGAGTPGERETILATGVAEFAHGEIPNGLDDNGNGLIDERGLSMTYDSGEVTVLLSVERVAACGHLVVGTSGTTVALR